ncbi:MAG TPA: HAD family hydrolase [Thermomicrobiales bacterium]|nr:HAD family hydrolase [Thermomicrobiales bacterium]
MRNHIPRSALIFDLDGTLVDNVYLHVLAWQRALEAEGIELSVWRIHRRIGMSGGLFVNALLREIDQPIDADRVKRIGDHHAEFFAPLASQVRPLPGSRTLLQTLTDLSVPWAIATSGHMRSAHFSLDMLGVSSDTATIITRDLVERAKPDPDLFIAAANKLDLDIGDCIIVGDSIWDMLAAQRARALGVGLRSGGYGSEELERAGAYRVYDDPLDLLHHLDEIGVRQPR